MIMMVGDSLNKRFSLVLIILIILFPRYVFGESINSMNKQLQELKKQKTSIDNGKKLSESERNKLKSEIASINANISKTENEIKKAEDDILTNEKEYEDKRDEINNMLIYLQINSASNVYLEYLLSADSYTDFIYRYSVVTQMTEHNDSLMDEINDIIDTLNNKKKDLSKKESELSTQRAQVSTKLSTLNASINSLEEEGTSIDDDIDSLKKDINRYQKMGCSSNESVDSCVIRINAEKEAARKAEEAKKMASASKTNSTNKNVTSVTNNSSNNVSSSVNSSGWVLPLSSATVTSQFQVVRTDCINCGGTSHRGIDLGVPEGTNVYSAANGEVAYVVTSGSSLSCGGIKVYIYHVVGGKLYTTVYMHLLSANVRAGQSVTANTVIGRSGGRSTAIKYGGYDSCTTGAHLHFGVANGNSVANFNSNAFNPRNLKILASAYDGAKVYR